MTARSSTRHWRLSSGFVVALLLVLPAHADDQSVDLANGANVYNGTCIACHGPDGTGAIPGTPDFTKAHGVLSLPEEVLEKRVENGYQAPDAPMAMPPRGGNASLSDQDVKDALAYMHRTFAKQ